MNPQEQPTADQEVTYVTYPCATTQHRVVEGACPWCEIDELKRDAARYENGRVVMTAEIAGLREKLNEAQQLAMRQAHLLRRASR